MLEELDEILSNFSSTDLLAKVGALNLSPQNASRAISLDALAHLIASHPDHSGSPAISLSRLKALFSTHVSNDSTPGMADDPASEMFTEELLFSGGPYVVFPGPSASEQNLVRWLLQSALLRISPIGRHEFRDEVTRSAILCLASSDAIAKKAGIQRGQVPAGSKFGELFVPDSKTMAAGMSAVMFRREELVSITHGETYFASIIEPLSIPLGDVDWDSYSFDFGQLHYAPFVRSGERYVVPSPSLLLPALRHRILTIAQSHGVLAELIGAYRDLIWAEVKDLLAYRGSHQIDAALPNKIGSSFLEGLFSLDSDKAIYIQLATDDLGDFAGEYEPSKWDTSLMVPELERSTAEIVGKLTTASPGPNRILILTILQSAGRWFVVGSGDPPDDSLRITLTASELKSILLTDEGDPLGIWKFALAQERIRVSVQVVAIGVLDEYETYRSNQHSYYLSDDRRPNMISIVPGEGISVKKRVSEKLDPHGVPSFHLGNLVEVWSMFGGKIPISSPLSQLGKRIALVVEGGSKIPVWVIGPESIDPRLVGPVAELAETMAYWMWQFEVLLTPVIEEIAQGLSTFVIQIDIGDSQQWSAALDGSALYRADSRHVISSAEQFDAGIKLTLDSSLLAKLGTANNQGERTLLEEFFRTIRESYKIDNPELKVIISDLKIQDALDEIAPLGQKKKILLFPLNSHRELDPTEIPTFRPVQESDFAELLDGVGNHLSTQGWKEGKIFPDNRNGVLNEVVKFLYHILEELVAEFDRNELLRALVAYNETNTRETFNLRLTVPTRLACFGDREGLVEALLEEIPRADAANLCNRFLIEYVAACPPDGGRHVSLEVYDQLMALASEIINWGMFSDFVRFDLTQAELYVLPSGRLGYDRAKDTATRSNFMSNHLEGYVSESQRAFRSHWRNSIDAETTDRKSPPGKEELDLAFESEYGLTLTDIILLMMNIYDLGSEQQGPIKQSTTQELIPKLSESLSWQAEKVTMGIDLLSLGPRLDFLEPPGDSAQEVYPWRFNRAWSFLRRPIIRTGYEPDSLMMWGNRHLNHAMRYLTELCIGGRIKAKSSALKKVIGHRRELEAKAFESLVAQTMTDLTGTAALIRVRKVGKSKILENGKDLGDIDVLAVIPNPRLILPIECKDLALARTPAEITNQLQDLVVGSSSHLSTAQKHLARAKWVEDNIEKVLMDCFGIKKKGKWRVQPMLISDSELYATYVGKIPFPVCSIERLMRMTAREIATKF